VRAEIVSVGTELLLGQIVDTNAAYLARVLSELGIALYRRVTVGDNRERLLAALTEALASSDVIFTIGGLGPTMDDITRDVLAEAMGDTLHQDEQIAVQLRRFFEQRGMPILESNLRQALVPSSGRAIPNPNGTAPGLLFEGQNGKLAIALPGPPNEFIPMVNDFVVPYLRTRTGGKGVIRSLVLRVAGVGESFAEDRIKDLMQDANPTVAPYAKVGEVHLRITAFAETPDEAERLIAQRAALIRQRLGHAIYGENEETLEQAVVSLLQQRQQTVATGESCTGGLLSGRITEVPGSSKVFLGGVVAYSNAAKTAFLGVDSALLAQFGAVSEEVARAMAEGAQQRFGTTYGIGITGIAGPEGGTPEKPVGLVYIALSQRDRGSVVERCEFIGSRAIIRHRATQTALNLLRLRLLES